MSMAMEKFQADQNPQEEEAAKDQGEKGRERERESKCVWKGKAGF